MQKFNRNHIEISYLKQKEKIEDIKVSLYSDSDFKIPYWMTSNLKHRNIRKISKLGFTYMSQNVIGISQANYQHNTYTITTPDGVYKIAFYYKYGETRIGPDTRPWELIPGDEYMADDKIAALYNELKHVYSVFLNYNKKVEYFDEKQKISCKDAYNRFSASINTQIFGNANGPRHQTDMEKILSHGFDPKISFRKRKENK